jgi:hypothetical protein
MLPISERNLLFAAVSSNAHHQRGVFLAGIGLSR